MNWVVPTPRAVAEARTASGETIFVRQHGNPHGPRLVISHGNGLAADALYPFWSLLLERFEVLLFDVRHHGWNPPPCGADHHIPAFLDDWKRVSECTRRSFGEKTTIGVFHSLTAVLAVLDQRRPENRDYAGLVLFDLPLWRRNEDGWDMGRRVQAMSAQTRRRRDRYRSRRELSEELQAMHCYRGLLDGVHDLIAKTTTRPADDTRDDYVVCCPRRYEARLYEDIWVFGTLADLLALRIPVKVIGGDPTSKHSFMPSLSFEGIMAVDYDYVPETTHVLPLERPDVCATLTAEFLAAHGFV